ncbi:hypothetical protein Ssi03_21770 [Sphaerisporangium siamense]|uniref:Zn-dependent protease with chaperone function n=1 Tax=Sphaerisporangium siamense TaxID=795645 RepID=A0A7W7GAL3_9ACTN|nr:M48 family metalloprotease [Sphaerisporangium siamense]MBB4701905.1 Zn-dependent protease with chaperone function [Sphaerisporangium siamense]GII84187.1 hypothetical protein Ssi03_21770 [Sphaerisporangium siamense]
MPARLGNVGTNPRFALLILALVAATASMADEGLLRLTIDNDNRDLGCMLAAGVDPRTERLANLMALIRNDVALTACYARFSPVVSWWRPAIVLIVLLVSAAGLFLALPWWRARRTRPIIGEADHTVLRELMTRAGIDQGSVRFVVDPSAMTSGAVAFGRPGSYTVSLHAGLLARRQADPAGFTAVVLHELAHVRAGDVRLAYATTALWRVFLIIVLLPFATANGRILARELFGWSEARSLFWPGAAPILVRELALAGALTLLVTVTRANLLRHREHQADLAAVRWGGEPDVWSRYVEQGPRRLRDLWSSHPSWQSRRTAIERAAAPGETALPMVLTGAATLFVTAVVSDLPTDFGLRGDWSMAAAVLTGLLAGSIVVGTVTPTNGVRAGLWFGLGLVLAEAVLNRIDGNQWLPSRPWMLLALPLFAVFTCRLAAELTALWRRWTVARVVLTAFVLAGWLLWWEHIGKLLVLGHLIHDQAVLAQLGRLGQVGGQTVPLLLAMSANLIGFTTVPLWPASATAACLVPLVVSVFLGGSRPSLPKVLLAGLAGGALALLLNALALTYLHSQIRPPIDARALAFVVTLFLIFTTLAGVIPAALWTAWRAVRFRLLTTLAVTALSVTVAAFGIFLMLGLDGCLGPVNLVARSCSWKAWFGASWPQPIVAVLVPSVPVVAVVALLPFNVRRSEWAGGFLTETGRSVRRGALVLVAAVVPVLLTVAGLPTDGGVSLGFRSTAEITDVPAVTRASSELRAAQAAAWLQYGGGALLMQYGNDLEELGNDLKLKSPNGELDEKKAIPRLRALVADIQRIRRYFQLPDPPMQRHWSAAIDALDRDVKTMLTAAEQDDSASFEKGLNHLLTSSRQIMDIAQELISLAAKTSADTYHY